MDTKGHKQACVDIGKASINITIHPLRLVVYKMLNLPAFSIISIAQVSL